MTYYINPIWFYLMNVSDTLQFTLMVIGYVMLIGGAVAIPMYIFEECVNIAQLDDEDKKCVGMLVKVVVCGITLFVISAFLPSKETCIEMMIASQVTQENVSDTKEEIYQIVDYVTDKIYEEESEE